MILLAGIFRGNDMRAKLSFVPTRGPRCDGAMVPRNPGFVLDRYGTCTYVSKPLAKIFACRPEMLLGAPWATMLHPQGASFIVDLMETPGIAAYSFQRRLGTSEHYVSTILRTIYAADHLTVLGYVGMVKMLALHACRAETREQTA